jgi:hypothetical protein
MKTSISPVVRQWPVITLFLLIFALSSAHAQTSSEPAEKKAVFGLKTGFNVSMLSAAINSESSPKVGMHLGVYVRTKLARNFFFRPELYYSRQGQKDKYVSPGNGQSRGETTTRLNYLNVPLLFEAGNKFCFQFGPQLGILLAANERGTINNVKVDDDLKSIMKTTDFALALGAGFYPTKHLSLGVRYNIGLTTIFDNTSSGFPDVHNRLFHLNIGYSF